jgi:Leucine-rich repeat (LRR) protein
MSNTSAKRAPKRDPDPRLTHAFDEARISGGEDLSLWDTELEEVPKQVWSFKNLKSLDLGSNRLRSVPQSLAELGHLKSVILVNNPIEHLPNLPGLMLDDATLFRLRSQIDRSNVTGLVVSGEIHGLNKGDWLSEIHSLRNLQELTIGDWALSIGQKHPTPTKSELLLIDSLSDFPSLETLSIRGRSMPPPNITRGTLET